MNVCVGVYNDSLLAGGRTRVHCLLGDLLHQESPSHYPQEALNPLEGGEMREGGREGEREKGGEIIRTAPCPSP